MHHLSADLEVGDALVAAVHPLAGQAGVRILEAGGNAMDAALAVAAVTNVVLPGHCGIGGDAFLLYYEADSNQVYAINSSGVAPSGASPEFFRDAGFAIMPSDGILSTAVPGQVAAYSSAHRFARLPMPILFADAIALAADGFPVDDALHSWIAREAEKLLRHPGNREVFFPGGEPPDAGELLVQKDLARTLRNIAEAGSDAFYRGEFARAFYATARALNGLYDGTELAGHTAEVYCPPSVTYRGRRVFAPRPVSQGLIFLESMQILEQFDVARLLPGEADLVHLMVEIKKLAFADRNAYIGDPEVIPFPYESLIAPDYAKKRSAKVDMESASLGPAEPGDPLGDTTYLCTVDSAGNACSFIHSLSHLFGSGVMVEGTGVLLNNRAGRGFSLEAGHPNCIAPGKRTMHTLNCYLVLGDDGSLWVGGTPGGDGQPQWNMQVLSYLLDFGMSPRDAVDFPRWTSFPGTDPASFDQPMVLKMEDRFDGAAVEVLQARGHVVELGGPWEGGGEAMLIGRSGVQERWRAASDARSRGIVLGY